MAKIFRITVLALLCCGLYGCGSHAANDGSVVDISAGSGKTQVIIIGTIHGAHHTNPKYSCEVLKEIILSLKPDVILNELPLSLVEPNGRPLERLRDKKISPECWATSTVAVKLGIKQIPFDRPDRQENFRKTNYFERQESMNKLVREWFKEQEKENPISTDLKLMNILMDASGAQAEFTGNAGPEIINSEGFDSLIRIKHSVGKDIMSDVFEKYPEYQKVAKECMFFRGQWLQRNEIMVENIVKTAKKYTGKRLVVVTGCEHRYILRDLLKDEESIELKEYWQVNRN